VLGVLALWALVALLPGAAVFWIFQRGGSWIVPHFHDRPGLMILVLGGLVALWACLSFLLGIFNSATFALSILGLGERLGVPLGEPDQLSTPAAHGRPGPRMGWHALAAILVAGVVVAAGTGYWLLQGIQVDDQVRIVAHRGAAGKAPENTLASVRQAIEDGTDWVEIDVQETRDGEVVVVHDSDFMKLAGVDLKVWDASMDQLDAIDVGAWFGPAFRGERVPALRQVLELARGKVGVVIELKYYGHDQQLEQRVVDRVEAAGMASEVVIMSLDYAAIQKIRALRPDWTIGLLSAKAIGDLISI
jgi:glycerophosphoryl diester phosphodiesterase